MINDPDNADITSAPDQVCQRTRQQTTKDAVPRRNKLNPVLKVLYSRKTATCTNRLRQRRRANQYGSKTPFPVPDITINGRDSALIAFPTHDSQLSKLSNDSYRTDVWTTRRHGQSIAIGHVRQSIETTDDAIASTVTDDNARCYSRTCHFTPL